MSSNGVIYNVVKKLTGIFYIQHNHFASCNGTKSWKVNVPEVISINSNMKYAVLLLDRPIVVKTEYFRKYWNDATVRVTIDGGTRQWDRFYQKQPEEVQKTLKKPDLITGDFDSVTSEILEKYKKQGCKIVHTPDQYHTDFTKCLMELNVYCKEHDIEMDHVIAMGESSGRIDQIIGNIQTLFLNKEKRLLDPNTTVYILSDDALSWLLCPGEHVIVIPEDSRTHRAAWCSLIPIGSACDSVSSTGLKWNLEKQLIHLNTTVYILSDDALSWLLCPGEHVIVIPEDSRTHRAAWCSLIPIGSTCDSVTSTGLKWNLDNQPLKFGELVSTSNTFSGSNKVTIKCSHPLLWSMRIPSLMNGY